MAASLMIQGTMSNVGKSLITAGLCRVFSEDGFRVSPFKSQNMALNSFVTRDGLEMGRAQAMQAYCAGKEPDVRMNPVLLKPVNDRGSEVIVMGEPQNVMKAKDYLSYKKELLPVIKEAYDSLSKENDIIVIEGAGSPVEMNLKRDDIVNMGLADLVDAKVLLVGDVDRGGVFAQLLGTLDLLSKSERERVCGLIVNKLRGDFSLFDDGVRIIEEKGKKPVLGVLPYIHINVEDEDSLSEFLERGRRVSNSALDIAVLKTGRISNYTDIYPFLSIDRVSVRFIERPEEIGDADIIIIPGSRNTIGDLRRLKTGGFSEALHEYSKRRPVIGICGGLQMLGTLVSDPENTEEGGEEEGFSLLPIKTILTKEKKKRQTVGRFEKLTGPFQSLSGKEFSGYEIHTGRSFLLSNGDEITTLQNGNVFGTYIHGFLDNGSLALDLSEALSKEPLSKGLSFSEYREAQHSRLSAMIRENLDIEAIYRELSVK